MNAHTTASEIRDHQAGRNHAACGAVTERTFGVHPSSRFGHSSEIEEKSSEFVAPRIPPNHGQKAAARPTSIGVALDHRCCLVRKNKNKNLRYWYYSLFLILMRGRSS